MFTANRTLNAIDIAFTIIDRIERIDYIKLGEQVIDKAIIAAAIIYGVATYIITACQLWWEDYNETIIVGAIRFTFIIADTIGAVYYAGVNSRPVIINWTNRLADSAFYAIAG